jgi:predicted DNA-binding transcriptional regulator AlpA
MSTKLLDEIDPRVAALLRKVDDIELRLGEVLRKVDDIGSPRIGLVRKIEVCSLLSISTWTLERWVAQGKFPPPIQLQVGSPVVWRVKDIEGYLDRCRRARRPKRKPRGMFRHLLKQEAGDAR